MSLAEQLKIGCPHWIAPPLVVAGGHPKSPFVAPGVVWPSMHIGSASEDGDGGAINLPSSVSFHPLRGEGGKKKEKRDICVIKHQIIVSASMQRKKSKAKRERERKREKRKSK